jgi:hypothetical protein
MRLKPACLFLFLLACSNLGLNAQPKQFGIGLALFDPSGLTGKAWLGNGRAINGAIGWSEEKGHYLDILADFLFYDKRVAGDGNLDLDAYIGIGGKIIFRDDDPAWIRLPLGFDMRLKRSPVDVFFEVAPSTNFSIVRVSGAIGFRYLFGS